MGNIAGETGISGAPPQAPNRNDSPFSPFTGRSPKDQIEKKLPGANFKDPKAFHEYYAVNHPKELKDSRTARAEKYGYNQQYDFTPRVDEEGNPVRLSEIMNQQSPESRTVGNPDMDAVGQSRGLSNPDDTTFAFSQQTSQGVGEQMIAHERTQPRDGAGERERAGRAASDNPLPSGDGSPSRGGRRAAT